MSAFELWAVMPLLILVAGSLLVLLLGPIVPGRHLTAIGVAASLGAAFWSIQPPLAPAAAVFGLTVTPLASCFTVVFSLIAAATLLLARDHAERRGISGEEYPATILFAAFGMSVLAAAATLLTLFLGLEALTFAFYILVAIDRRRPASAEAGLKYLLLGAVSAAFIAFGIALVYAATGTLAVSAAMEGAGRSSIALAGWGLILAGAAFKVSLVPAHLWTPDVYEGAPAPVVAFLATGSKGAAILFLVILMLPAGAPPPVRALLRLFSLLSMTVGNLAALRQTNLRRLLAYSSIAQMGYVALALTAGGPAGLGAALLYAIFYAAMNLAAFGAVTAMSAPEELITVEECRGLGYTRPFPAAILALALFALAGIPPTAGFVGKFFIFSAALRAGEYLPAILGILTAAVSIYYYLRVVVNLYLRPQDLPPAAATAPTAGEGLVLVATAAVIVLFGVWPGPLLDFLTSALR